MKDSCSRSRLDATTGIARSRPDATTGQPADTSVTDRRWQSQAAERSRDPDSPAGVWNRFRRRCFGDHGARAERANRRRSDDFRSRQAAGWGFVVWIARSIRRMALVWFLGRAFITTERDGYCALPCISDTCFPHDANVYSNAAFRTRRVRATHFTLVHSAWDGL